MDTFLDEVATGAKAPAAPHRNPATSACPDVETLLHAACRDRDLREFLLYTPDFGNVTAWIGRELGSGA